MNKNECLDVQNYGQCMKGNDCIACNQKNDEVNLNLDAKVYVPKSKQKQNNIEEATEKLDKLNFNLNAKEYVPTPNIEIEDYDVEEENEDEDEDELNMIVKDIMDQEEVEEDESDDEKWFPKYKDCDCCKGFVYKCQGPACLNMGTCYCKVKEECDDEY
jgi:hypothetical protein